MTKNESRLAKMDAIHGAPDYDPAELSPDLASVLTRRQPCRICGGPAPTSPDDSSHDDC